MHTSRRSFLRGAGAAVVGAGALAHPSTLRAQARPGVPADPVKVGVLASRSGVTAPVGQAGLRATEWWAERTNRAGASWGGACSSWSRRRRTPRTRSSATGSSCSRRRSTSWSA